MYSLNLANMAISSAIAIAPFSYAETAYDNAQQVVQKQVVMNAELRETLIVSETLLGAFFKILSHDHAVFERLDKVDMLALFEQSEQLIQSLRLRFTVEKDVSLLESFAKTVEKANQLYQAIDYKKEADRVLLSRVDSPIAVTFDQNSTDDELRAFIFGV